MEGNNEITCMLQHHFLINCSPNEPVEEVLICQVPDDQDDDIFLDGDEVADEIDYEQDDY